jgi:hypothetical protein
MRGGTNQEWRSPLRDAITQLAEGLHAVYEREASRYFDDPWAVRDAYGEVVATPDRIREWVAMRVRSAPGGAAASGVSPQSLLEMERGALRIFTSCAWFFDDIAGLEPIEVLRYAARAIELAGPDGPGLEKAFLSRLGDARSNEPGMGTGRDVYLTIAKPTLGQFARLAGSVAAARTIAAGDPEALAASPAIGVRASETQVEIQQLRTGVADVFDVSVIGATNANADNGGGAGSFIHGPAAVAVRVATTPPLELTAPEMTERQRAAIERGIRRRLLEAAFDGERPPSGDWSAGERIERAVIEAIEALPSGPSDRVTTRVIALLDLLELDGRHVPFDAQTRFYDGFLASRTGNHDPIIAEIARRLGFTA